MNQQLADSSSAPTAAQLSGASCTSSRFCMAVGSTTDSRETTTTLAERWDGSRWTVLATPKRLGVHTYNSNPPTFKAVSCTSPTACTAVGMVGDATLAERWIGSSWTVQPSPNPVGVYSELDGVYCTATDGCLAVGSGIESWNGSTWTVQPATSFDGVPRLSPIACPASATCQAAGRGPLVEAWDGMSWTQTTPPLASGIGPPQLNGIYCASPTSCLAVGAVEQQSGANAPYAYQWDGTSWSVDSRGADQALERPHPPGGLPPARRSRCRCV